MQFKRSARSKNAVVKGESVYAVLLLPVEQIEHRRADVMLICKRVFSNNNAAISLVFNCCLHSGFSSQRINLSPFTKDFRGEEQYNESNDYFSSPTQ